MPRGKSAPAWRVLRDIDPTGDKNVAPFERLPASRSRNKRLSDLYNEGCPGSAPDRTRSL